MADPCTKVATWGKFGTPVCCCQKCSEERMETMRRVFTHAIEVCSGPEWDYEKWDYEKKDSYTNAEHGE